MFVGSAVFLFELNVGPADPSDVRCNATSPSPSRRPFPLPSISRASASQLAKYMSDEHMTYEQPEGQ